MGRVQTPSLATDFLNFQFSDKVAVQDLHTGSIALAANAKTRDTLWEYIKGHWEAVRGKMAGNKVVMDRYFKSTLGKFASWEMEREVEAFFGGKDTKGFDRGLVQVADSIRGNAKYREREERVVEEWLRAHEYL
jgi:aminopeptidase N